MQGNPLLIDGFPSQKASNVQTVSISWLSVVYVGSTAPLTTPTSTVTTLPTSTRTTTTRRVITTTRNPMFIMRWVDAHDDVIKWKHFPRCWPFVCGIHRSPVNSPHKGQGREALKFSFIYALNKRLSKQSWCWWFETSSRSLWRHCNNKIISMV